MLSQTVISARVRVCALVSVYVSLFAARPAAAAVLAATATAVAKQRSRGALLRKLTTYICMQHIQPHIHTQTHATAATAAAECKLKFLRGATKSNLHQKPKVNFER